MNLTFSDLITFCAELEPTMSRLEFYTFRRDPRPPPKLVHRLLHTRTGIDGM